MFQVKTLDEVYALIDREYHNYPLEEQEITVESAYGYVLSKDVFSVETVPHFNRSTVDGYACISKVVQQAKTQSGVLLEMVGTVEMGHECHTEISEYQCMYVPTGGHLPKHADCVVMIEHTDTVGNHVFIEQGVSKWENVFLKGTDIKKGELLFSKGMKINERVIGSMLACGIQTVNVYRKLNVSIISTGDELTISKELKIGQIRDINTYTIKNALLDKVNVISTKVVPDDITTYKNAIYDGFLQSDIVIASGGSSVGEKDYTKQIMTELSANVFVHGIHIKPGKPTVLATYHQKAFIGLPGQPLSAYIVLHVLIDRYLQNMYHSKKVIPSYRMGVLQQSVHSTSGREQIQIVHIDEENRVHPLFSKSGMIYQLSNANGYIVVENNLEGIDANTVVRVYSFG